MLQIKNISKDYVSGELTVHALKDVSVNFRKSEFVAILGQSGCGKTTLLNIVGGLDKYTTGDLVINGKSTKDFDDRDWDTYRNHTIGFVFQTYNLIPHQSVLQNVELALALSGVKKAERKRRAKEALDKVGLAGLYNKRPSEMSGGQMQRVAIARAIVNNPDIILADEPTGALDTETSVQVMEILKEIATERLVVMVTHNPELADKYATRTVRMLDGNVIADSMPYADDQLEQAVEQHLQTIAEAEQAQQQLDAQSGKKRRKKRTKKPSLSFGTSFMLSLKNLISKKGRTVLTSFAGSIGIIGIALIFAVSSGMTQYINMVQEETLASYPLTLEQTHSDMSSMFLSFTQSAQSNKHEVDDKVYEKLALYNLTKALNSIEESENDLGAYKKHLDEQLANPDSDLYAALNGVHYSYGLDLLIYTKNVDGEIIQSDTGELMMKLMGQIYGMDMSSVTMASGGLMSSLMSTSMGMTMWQELLPGKEGQPVNDILHKQYDLVAGSWPNEKDEVVIVVDKNNEIDDMTLYALGLKSTEEIEAIINSAMTGKTPAVTAKQWTFEEILGLSYKTIFNYECYEYSQITKTWLDIRDENNGILGNGLQRLYDDPNSGLNLKVSGIIRPNESASSHMLSGTICYTNKLTQHVITQAQTAPIVLEQKANPDVDVFTGLYFQDNNISNEVKAQKFEEYVNGCNDQQKAAIYLQLASVPSQTDVQNKLQYLNEQAYGENGAINEDGITKIKTELKNALRFASPEQDLGTYVDSLSAEALIKMFPTIAPAMAQYDKVMQLYMQYPTPALQAQQLDVLLASPAATTQVKAAWFDEVVEMSPTTYEDNLASLGCLDLANPSAINLYATSFANKDVIEANIAAYNKGKADEDQIKYTDYVGLLMSGITTIIDAITYVLIAFVSISLIVSSIMIGVITLISVQERTKEIGILRAVGASKNNVSGMFNVETVIIGFASGVLGVVVTYLLCIPINLILHALTGIATLNAILPVWAAFVLIAISMVLTLIAGIIPSRSAAKKDPVVALRTE